MWVRSSVALCLVLAAQPPAPKPLARGPIALYDRACANCHGPNGSFYGPELGQGKTDAQLYKAVQDMADNQGQIELAPVEVEAITAYHRAIIKHEPFLAVTRRTKSELKGEVTKGSLVTVTVAGKPQKVTLVGTLWSAALEGGGAVVITARRKNAQVQLDPDQAAHSQGKPLATNVTK
jgi:hypothetical protein